jgi:tetratricopeptide (TPR) repeat protein
MALMESCRSQDQTGSTLKVHENILEQNHRDIAFTINSLSSLYLNKGGYAKAEPLFQHAIAIKEKAMEPEHLSVANSLLYLASPYCARGEYVKAEPMFESALKIYQKALGQEHPTIAERGRS